MLKLMKKLFLGLALAVSLACAPPSKADASTPTSAPPAELKVSGVFLKQVQIIRAMGEAFPDVDVQIYREQCGEENAYYWSKKDSEEKGWIKPRIILCEEMDEYPAAALIFAAHEMGHAITDEYTNTMSEIDADEIGALAMIRFGYTKELLESVEYYRADPDQNHMVGDPHPSNGFRAWYFGCLANGSLGKEKDCIELYNATNMKWFMRLTDPFESEEPDVDVLLQEVIDQLSKK